MITSAATDSPTPGRKRPLRRLAAELILLVIAKIIVLTLIWAVAIAPYQRPDTRPQAIEHLLAPVPSSPSSTLGAHP